ncbi:MAG: flagellar type III secretion system pore protein FliP [Gemmatimonadetes bacterium]|nr:flagellar type III secretion system pore protein FliP [Gemmatimonadota bacterium]
MLLTYVGVLLALVAILALVAGLGRAYRRFGMGASRDRTAAPLDVLQRTALGPRQGVALLRVGSRVMLVSIGDGGVHRLMQVEDDDALQMLAARGVRTDTVVERTADNTYAPVATPRPAGTEIFRRAFAHAVGLKGAALLLLFAVATSSPLGAQAAPAAAPITASTPGAAGKVATGTSTGAIQNPAATAATVVERLAPRMDLRLGAENGGEGLRMNGTVGVVIMMGLLSLLPTLVLMTTGFTRILVVLYFLRQALGTQTSPPAPLIAGLALILTGFVMAPTMTRLNQEAITPWLDGRIQQVEMLEKGTVPLRDFMLRQTRPADVRRMVRLSRQPVVAGEQVPFITLMAAFVISELRTAFAIGFALFLPFIVIDVVVASVLMSLGMFMLPPTMIALPFKLLLFVLVDGWGLITQSLVAGFR